MKATAVPMVAPIESISSKPHRQLKQISSSKLQNYLLRRQLNVVSKINNIIYINLNAMQIHSKNCSRCNKDCDRSICKDLANAKKHSAE
ncbi:hypothetical protein V6N13_021895 [Hibiscus sabdariffa]|uniref:Uncharacterized protein n=1 Tax=Hibiscus sabdariffa TaxID=183260 RepID=A0ABR2CQ00_9ROSI